MTKHKYWHIGKPLKYETWEENTGLIGWIRDDILKRKLRENKEFKNKFTKEELKIIRR